MRKKMLPPPNPIPYAGPTYKPPPNAGPKRAMERHMAPSKRVLEMVQSNLVVYCSQKMEQNMMTSALKTLNLLLLSPRLCLRSLQLPWPDSAPITSPSSVLPLQASAMSSCLPPLPSLLQSLSSSSSMRLIDSPPPPHFARSMPPEDLPPPPEPGPHHRRCSYRCCWLSSNQKNNVVETPCAQQLHPFFYCRWTTTQTTIISNLGAGGSCISQHYSASSLASKKKKKKKKKKKQQQQQQQKKKNYIATQLVKLQPANHPPLADYYHYSS